MRIIIFAIFALLACPAWAQTQSAVPVGSVSGGKEATAVTPTAAKPQTGATATATASADGRTTVAADGTVYVRDTEEVIHPGRCRNCRSQLRLNDRFCSQCGIAIWATAWFCTGCGNTNPLGQACIRCTRRMAEPTYGCTDCGLVIIPQVFGGCSTCQSMQQLQLLQQRKPAPGQLQPPPVAPQGGPPRGSFQPAPAPGFQPSPPPPGQMPAPPRGTAPTKASKSERPAEESKYYLAS